MAKSVPPDFSIERELAEVDGLVIGLDEVGRGPLAGPLVVGGCAFVGLDDSFEEELISHKIKDSKKFSSHEAREKVANYIMSMEGERCFTFFVRMDTDYINNEMLSGVSLNDVQRDLHDFCATELRKKIEKAGYDVSGIMIDGELPLVSPENVEISECVVDGDKTSLTIAAASIIAKVHRDRIMILMDEKYPEYGFAKHKGYGSVVHRNAIDEHGYCPEHRVRFGCVKGKKKNMKYFENS